METKWVGKEEAGRAARREKKAAMLCSWRHWDQLAKASPKEAKEISYFAMFAGYCALCIYHKRGRVTHCGKCGLGCLVGGSVWKIALSKWKVIKDLLSREDVTEGNAAWIEWVKAAESMRDRIASLYVKTYVARRRGEL